MNVFPLGRIIVTTAGIPVPVSADTKARATELYFTQAPGNSVVHILYDGVKLRSLAAAPATGMLDNHNIIAEDDRWLELSRFSVDASVNGQGVDVYYVES